ncbi:MAG: hypothetical protein QNJ27_00260 [Simkaniaceae bacterium]|nr:hypothetical protein [Simkaniaceae bacterium]
MNTNLLLKRALSMPFSVFCFLSYSSVAVLIFTGCATSYQPEGLDGGYSETLMAHDTYIVTFKGNEFTSHEQSIRYALKRASELTLYSGYKYFSISSSVNHSEQIAYSNTYENASSQVDVYGYSSSMQGQCEGSSSIRSFSGITTKPAVSILIKCYHEKPKNIETVDARFFLANN